MFLILSGEGSADIGIEDDAIGPMTKLIDNWIFDKTGYSFINEKTYSIISKQQLVQQAKKMKARSMKGKKQDSETRYFYKNARALALIAHQKAHKTDDITRTRMLLNDKIDDGEIDIDRIDMDSLNKFKKRLNDVLKLLGYVRSEF